MASVVAVPSPDRPMLPPTPEMVVMTPAEDHGANRAVAGIGDQDRVIGADGHVLRIGEAGDGGGAGVGSTVCPVTLSAA